MRILIVLLSFFWVVEATAQPVFHVAYGDKGTPPYYNGDGPSVPHSKPGLVIELLNMIAQDLDIKVTYSRMPWKQVLSSMAENKADAIFDASFNTSRQKIGRYPYKKDGQPDGRKSIYRRSYILFVADEKAVHWDGNDLISDGRAVAAKEGFSILQDLNNHSVPNTTVQSRMEGFGLLKKGRLAGFADLEIEGENFLKTHGSSFDGISVLRRPLKTKDYFLMISHGFYKEHPELAEEIWAKIPEVLASKKMREIKRTYVSR